MKLPHGITQADVDFHSDVQTRFPRPHDFHVLIWLLDHGWEEPPANAQCNRCARLDTGFEDDYYAGKCNRHGAYIRAGSDPIVCKGFLGGRKAST